MKSGVIGLAAVVVVAALPFLTGCAEDEYETREVAYPQPIGYTTPPAEPPAQVQVAAQPSPSWRAAPQQVESSAQFAPSASGDYALGEEQAAPASDEYADDDPSALTDFRATLDPYGSWVDDPTYGTVWVPSSAVVGTDFTPYVTAGHWVYDDDYTWVSDYDWGWAPFHYGRWVWASGYGWEWIPGRDYAGAWVSWRYGWGDWGYVGWAPLGPTWCWQGGVAVGLGFVPAAPYAFVGSGELFAPSIGSRVVTGSQVGTIGAHTRPYVPASPTVNGRVAATPRVGGPSPAMLHIPATAVAHAGTTSRGVMQARAFAHPSTAMAMGARAPQGYASPRTGGLARANTPASPAPYRSPYASHFGGKLGYGFRGSAASAPPAYSYRAPSSLGSRPYYGGGVPHGSSPAPSFRGPSGGSYGGFRGGYSAPGGASGFRGAPGFAGHAPAAGTPSGGSHSSGGYSSGDTGGYHGGGFRGGGYHGGGFGGFHGGGGGGGGGHSGGGRR